MDLRRVIGLEEGYWIGGGLMYWRRVIEMEGVIGLEEGYQIGGGLQTGGE